MGRRQARRLRLLLAPAQEPPQARSQLEQPAVVVVGGRGRRRHPVAILARGPDFVDGGRRDRNAVLDEGIVLRYRDTIANIRGDQ
jgi:hypothetical protein